MSRPPSMRRILPTALVVVLALPAAAHASGEQVVRDCTDDGRMSKRYSQKDYRDALNNMPTDVDEYTDCRDVIRRAQLAAAGGGRSSGGGGGTAGGDSGGGPASQGSRDPLQTASPQEREAVADAGESGSKPVAVAGEVLRPGSPGSGGAQDGLSTIPTPLLVVLALLALVGLAVGGTGARKRVLDRRAA